MTYGGLCLLTSTPGADTCGKENVYFGVCGPGLWNLAGLSVSGRSLNVDVALASLPHHHRGKDFPDR